MTEDNPIAAPDRKEFEYSPGRARRFAEFYGSDAREAWVRYLATWFGAGLAPILPGTFGTLFALPPAWLIHTIFGPTALLIAAGVLFLIGIPICRAYIHSNEKADPGEVVIDEAAAVWMLLAFLPATASAYFFGFIVFRLFDMVKPWPVSLADKRIKGGTGIMLDDVLATAYPLLILLLLRSFGVDPTEYL